MDDAIPSNSHQRETVKSLEQGIMRQCDKGSVSRFFTVVFWLHQVVLGLPSMGLGLQLLTEGTAQGLIAVIALFLAWIGGTLVWGFAALIHQQLSYALPKLPPVFASIDEHTARLAQTQVHGVAVDAVAAALGEGNRS